MRCAASTSRAAAATAAAAARGSVALHGLNSACWWGAITTRPAAARGHSSGSSTMTSVDVTKHNFASVLPDVRAALEGCAFFAIDCEMTGLQTDTAKNEFLDDMQARYTKVADASRSYIITQYGLSCFRLTGPNAYEASSFNFFTFPRPHGNHNRRFLCDASSLTFLAQHNFDFNTAIRDGVSYMPARTRDWQLTQVNRSYEARAPATPSSAEDVAFLVELVQLVTDWLAGRPLGDSSLLLLRGDSNGSGSNGDQEMAAGSDEEGLQQQQARLVGELALAPLNSFRRLLAFQELRKAQFGVATHPGFWVKKGADSRCLVLVRATAQQAAALEAQDRAARIAAIHDAAGMAAVFDLMRACHKPCVGHNCMMDISYGLYSFADACLPASWSDFKKMAAAWHPGGIWDTKHLARQLPEVFEGTTALAEVFRATSQPDAAQAAAMQPLLAAASAAVGTPVGLPTITHAPGFDKYRHLAPGEAAHEAGYDAFMTGAAFAGLLPLVAGKVASQPSSEVAQAHAQAQQQQAAAAAAAAAASSSHAQAMQEGDAPEPAAVAPQQQGGGAALLQYVAGLMGRLNTSYSDMRFAALSGDDPIPSRPGTFFVSGLQPGYRSDDVMRLLRQAGLAQGSRVTPVDGCSCLVTFAPELALAAPTALAELDVGLIVTSWAEHAAARYQRGGPAPATAAAGDAGAAAGADAAAVVGVPGARRAAVQVSGVKRQRRLTAGEDAAAEADGGGDGKQRSCSIM